MRISDWSSDVCSSDLTPYRPCRENRYSAASRICSVVSARRSALDRRLLRGFSTVDTSNPFFTHHKPGPIHPFSGSSAAIFRSQPHFVDLACRCQRHIWNADDGIGNRSEEHTSELQSLMRISYAVFCLKKKKT